MKVGVTSETFACPTCGSDMRVMSYYEPVENPSTGQVYNKFQRYLTCPQTSCPSYGARLALPQVEVTVVPKVENSSSGY